MPEDFEHLHFAPVFPDGKPAAAADIADYIPAVVPEDIAEDTDCIVDIPAVVEDTAGYIPAEVPEDIAGYIPVAYLYPFLYF